MLNACGTGEQGDELRAAVDCVVGMAGSIGDDAARRFAVGFYRALGNGRSVGTAVDHAVATLAASELADERLPRCWSREGIDPRQLVLATN